MQNSLNTKPFIIKKYIFTTKAIYENQSLHEFKKCIFTIKALYLNKSFHYFYKDEVLHFKGVLIAITSAKKLSRNKLMKTLKKHIKTKMTTQNFKNTLKKTKKTIKNQDLLKKHCKNIEKTKKTKKTSFLKLYKLNSAHSL